MKPILSALLKTLGYYSTLIFLRHQHLPVLMLKLFPIRIHAVKHLFATAHKNYVRARIAAAFLPRLASRMSAHFLHLRCPFFDTKVFSMLNSCPLMQ